MSHSSLHGSWPFCSLFALGVALGACGSESAKEPTGVAPATEGDADSPATITDGDGAVEGGNIGGDGGLGPSGPPPGFALVKDINTAGAGSAPTVLGTVGGITFVAATDAQHGTELHRTDLTAANTALVSDIIAGPSSSSPKAIGIAGSRIVFSVDATATRKEIWSSDGTAAGTQKILDAEPCYENPAALLGNTLHFCARVSSDPAGKLYKTDGTAAGTSVASVATPASNIVSLGGALYYSALDGQTRVFWKFDGNGNGSAIVGGTLSPYSFATLGNKLLFWGQSVAAGYELWVSDGTAAGTKLLKDIKPGVPSARTGLSGEPPLVAGGVGYFVADDGVIGPELWKTDGTEDGTVLVKDILAGAGDAQIGKSGMIALGTKVLFTAQATGGSEVWISDGTESGTHVVKEIGVGSKPSFARGLVALGNVAYFSANDGLTGTELWKTDGTEAGTALVADVFAGENGSSPSGLTVVGNQIAFACADAQSYAELCASDGTAANTGVRARLNPNGTADGVVTVMGGGEGSPGFVFGAQSSVSTAGGLLTPAPWFSNGLDQGTLELSSAVKLPDTVGEPVAVGNLVYFRGQDADHGLELWKTDGTSAGTALVKDVAPGGQGGLDGPRSLFAVGNRLMFVARSGGSSDVWSTDGTALGTKKLTSFSLGQLSGTNLMAAAASDALYVRVAQGAESALYRVTESEAKSIATAKSIANIAVSGQNVYFTTYDAGVVELFAGDGQSATKIATLPGSIDKVGFAPLSAGKIAFMVRTDAFQAANLWVSDGTEAGTSSVLKLGPVTGYGPIGDAPLAAGATNGVIYFAARDAAGLELWRTDGTAAGTVRVRDVNVGDRDSDPRDFVALGGKVYFTAVTDAAGRELWSTDGTEAGTVLVGDLFPGTASAAPQTLKAFGGKLYFTAIDGAHGRELWAFTPN